MPQSAPKAFSPSSPAERALIFATVVLLPLESHFPAVFGASILFLMFCVLAVFVALNRVASLDRVWLHPVFATAFLFLLVAGALEFASPLSMYEDLGRFGLAMCGAILMACLCRDRSALRAGLYGSVCASVWLSSILFLISYNVLSGATAENFQDASYLRAEAFGGNPIRANLNNLALLSAQGGIVALALALVRRSWSSLMFGGIAGFCLLSTMLTMSRGAATIVMVSCATVLAAHGLKRARHLVLVSVLIGGLLAVMPSVVLSRMSFSTEMHDGKRDLRAELYVKALNAFSEYSLYGVGAGNFFKKWGFEKGFRHREIVMAVHNSLLQILINWGAVGLLAFLLIVWRVYLCIPSHCGRDELSLGLLGIMVSLGVTLLVSHNFYNKYVTLGVGMLVGSRRWIWPSGKVTSPHDLP